MTYRIHNQLVSDSAIQNLPKVVKNSSVIEPNFELALAIYLGVKVNNLLAETYNSSFLRFTVYKSITVAGVDVLIENCCFGYRYAIVSKAKFVQKVSQKLLNESNFKESSLNRGGGDPGSFAMLKVEEDLFGSDAENARSKTFTDHTTLGNIKGAVDCLRKLNQKQLYEEVLRAGYSMISFKHGKPAVIAHVINQIHQQELS